jgi:alpha-L-rhamnosidase
MQIRMKRSTGFALVRLVVFTLAFAALFNLERAKAVDSSRVKRLFENPSREYSTGPLWVWNDMLTEEEIRSTLRDLAKQQVKQVWVHPRPGLMTPYLSDEWFHLWKVALDEAKRLDMNVWIYDENSYPSGFAGGWVPELMPESRGQGLKFSKTKQSPKWDDKTLAIFRIADGTADNVTARVKAGQASGDGNYLVARIVRAPNTPWNAGRCYVNLLTPGVTEKFLDVTLEAYQKNIGQQFGKRVPGVFTDEPNIRPAGGLPWCDDLPEQFQKRWGYSLLDNLASLQLPVGDWRKVRQNYFSTLNDLFIQRWSVPYHTFCAQNHLEWTGHYWDHEWPNCGAVPDNMAMYAWHQRPAIDCLMNQYAENTHAQFGNARMVKELSSVANQLGMKRTLCETYGAGGWDLRFEDMKRIADWLEVLGVNTIDQHLSYITIRGARKRDHPQSFSYHEPWWDAYHISAEYLARLSAALSQGEQVNHILVIEPTTTAWMYQGDDAKLKEIGNSFFKLIMSLESAQIEYDIGDENILASHGSVTGKQLKVGQRAYDVVVIPPSIENLDATTWELLYRYVLAGGQVLCCAQTVGRSDGRTDASPPGLVVSNEHWQKVDVAELPTRLMRHQLQTAVTIVGRAPNDKGILFHNCRRLDDGELLFLVNTSIESPSKGTVVSSLEGVQKWDLDSGKIVPYPFVRHARNFSAEFELPPSGSLLLFLSKRPLKPAPAPSETTTVLATTGPTEIHRLEPNVLTLDYVDVTAGGETKADTYFYAAQQFAFQKNGLDRNPWDSAVQFKDEIISKKFAPDSGFTASYKFTIEDSVPTNLAIVIERPDLYTITCNGRPVAAEVTGRIPFSDEQSPLPHYQPVFANWWLDKSFGRIPIASAAHVGENVVTIKASPFTIFDELESAYVLGDFRLKATDKGFVITPDRPLTLGEWNKQGQPFYASGVAYRQQFNVSSSDGRYVVSLPKWYGSVAKVIVNDKLAGYIDAPPWECDVTKQLNVGDNSIEVVVIGTLKNTLGPHHGNPALGAAWPHAFQIGPASGPPPGEKYSTVGYGLFEPFRLEQRVAAH